MTKSSRSVINGLIQAFDLLRSYFSERTSSVLRANGKQWLEDALKAQILDRSYGMLSRTNWSTKAASICSQMTIKRMFVVKRWKISKEL